MVLGVEKGRDMRVLGEFKDLVFYSWEAIEQRSNKFRYRY